MDATLVLSPAKNLSVAVMNILFWIIKFLSNKRCANDLVLSPTVLCASSKIPKLISIFAFLTAYIAQLKNYNPKKWFYFGLILGLIAFIIILIEKKQNLSDVPLPVK